MLVIARAFDGRPLKREVIRRGNGRLYLANPDLLQALESGDSHPVGFPAKDVFAYKTDIYENLLALWNRFGSIPDSEWDALDNCIL
jgi:hypothetical protein